MKRGLTILFLILIFFNSNIFSQTNCYSQNHYNLMLTDGGNNYNSTSNEFNRLSEITNISVSNLKSIWFIDENTGFIAGSNSTVLKTTNGGSQWLSIYPAGTENFTYIQFFDINNGYLAGSNLYKTNNGGLIWDSLINLNWGNEIKFLNIDTGYYLSNGYLKKTFNGGINWISQFISTYANKFCFLENNDNGFALTSYQTGIPPGIYYHNEIYETTNNGESWVLIQSINNGWGSGYYSSINFLNNNIGFLSGGIGMRKTTDGGISWHVIYSYAQGYGFECDPFFCNQNVGYISSYNRILKTTNEGNNWFNIFNGSDNINSLFFNDNNTGYAVGDFGYILKTTNGGGIFVNVETENENIPSTYNLHQNYPNPFNPITKIEFDIPEKNNVQLIVYNMLGKQVATIVNSELEAGHHSFGFDGTNHSSGIYFYRLETENFSQTKKMLLVK